MYFQQSEHNPPHIHAIYGEYMGAIDIKTVKGLFEKVKVDSGGYGILWDDEIDLSCNELLENGYIMQKLRK